MAVHDKGAERRDEGLEGFIPDLVRRAVERSVQAILHSDEGRKNLVPNLIPRELIGSVMQQIDGTKKDAIAMIGREMQSFLQSLNVGAELTKILTSVQFEINTSVRFIPNEDGTLRSEVKSSARAKGRDSQSSRKTAASKEKVRRSQAKEKAARSSEPAAKGRVRTAAEGTRSRVGRIVEQVAERAAEIVDIASGEPRDL